MEIYPNRIEENARSIVALCHKRKVQVAGVTKVTCAHPSVVQALVAAGVDMLADSRIENLEAIRQMGTSLPLMLTRIPTPSHAARVVELADISLNSSNETIRLLSAAAQEQKKTHKVILMVDLGDLREGVWPDHLIETVQKTSDLPNIELIGLGSNLACYGGVIPTHEKMQMLDRLEGPMPEYPGCGTPDSQRRQQRELASFGERRHAARDQPSSHR